MTKNAKARALILALFCGTALAAPQQAAAKTLFDILFRKKAPVAEQQVQAPISEVQLADPQPKPLPKVTGPRYYTYKAEAMRRIDTAKLTDPVVTGAVSGSAAVAAMPSEQRQYLADTRVMATNGVAKAVEDYYGNGAPLLWVEGSGISDRARAAMTVLSRVDDIGLDPADYSVPVPPLNYDTVDMTARNKALMQFELALSAKVLAFVQDTQRGRIDPNKISGYHDFKRKDVRLDMVLKLIKASPDVAAYLNSRTPSSPHFTALKAEYLRLRDEADAEPPVSITLDGLLKPGQTSTQIDNIVAAIRHSGSDALKIKHAETISAPMGGTLYSQDLVALVEDFQSEAGLKPDGVIGKATVRAMVGETSEGKLAKLRVAMEQARWLPNDLGPRNVFINQPAYMVYYTNEGKEQLSMRVVVGSKSNQTYFFQDQLETVEFNPYWGVPASIIINEMLPKLRQDPGYLDRLGYEVSYKGQSVSSSQINWNQTHDVDVRQPPGNDNALGELKILFPNTHSIYMHDTPSKSFFKKDMRALSHGCVRLSDPKAMAAAVLGTSVADVQKNIDMGRNHAVQVKGNIPVYIAYFTAWPNKDGKVEYFDDVYGRDDYVRKAFDVTTKARQS